MSDQTQTNDRPEKEIFDDLFALLEAMETQNTAILEFLKGQGIATDEKLAPYFEQAGNASSVKWRAARARMEHIFSPIPQGVKDAKKEQERSKSDGEQHKPQNTEQKVSANRDTRNPVTGSAPPNEQVKTTEASNQASETADTNADEEARESEQSDANKRQNEQTKANDASDRDSGDPAGKDSHSEEGNKKPASAALTSSSSKPGSSGNTTGKATPTPAAKEK
jgi:hypothetical protein